MLYFVLELDGIYFYFFPLLMVIIWEKYYLFDLGARTAASELCLSCKILFPFPYRFTDIPLIFSGILSSPLNSPISPFILFIYAFHFFLINLFSPRRVNIQFFLESSFRILVFLKCLISAVRVLYLCKVLGLFINEIIYIYVYIRCYHC